MQLERRFFPEANVAGFGRGDSSVAFYNQVHALIEKESRVLDYGAGRGEHILSDPIPYRRRLKDIRPLVSHLEGCDVDAAVLENPYVSSARVIDPTSPLPYGDAEFDLVYSRYVFEHVTAPAHVASELMRVIKPGRWLCAITPNRWSYVALGAQIIPNQFHSRAVSALQPGGREARDVFPTRYKMNDGPTIRRLFRPYGDVYLWFHNGEVAYHFGSPAIYGTLKLLHALMPAAIRTAILVFVRKRDPAATMR